MSEFKGTDCKWEFIQNKEFPTLHEIWSDSKSIFTRGTYIARTCYAPSSEYNALLISKAPEMLEMLNDIKDYLGSDKRQEVEQLIKEATEL